MEIIIACLKLNSLMNRLIKFYKGVVPFGPTCQNFQQMGLLTGLQNFSKSGGEQPTLMASTSGGGLKKQKDDEESYLQPLDTLSVISPSIDESDAVAIRSPRPLAPSETFKYDHDHRNENLSHMYDNKLMMDVIIITDDRKHFKAHHAVLIQGSNYFRGILGQQKLCRCLPLPFWMTFNGRKRRAKYIRVRGITSGELVCFLSYAYRSEIVLDYSNVYDCMAMSKFFKLPEVLESCGKYLQAQLLNFDTSVDILNTAVKYKLWRLHKNVYAFIRENIVEVARVPRFRDLTLSQIQDIFLDDASFDYSELDIFKVLLKWVNYTADGFDRALPLFYRLHFNEIQPEALEKMIERHHKIFKYLRYFDKEFVKKLHAEAAIYLTCTPSQSQLRTRDVESNTRRMELAIVRIGRLDGWTISYHHRKSSEWRQLTIYPQSMEEWIGGVTGDRLYIFQSYAKKPNQHLAWRYYARYNEWEKVAEPTFRYGPSSSVTELDRKLYCLGGAIHKERRPFLHHICCEFYDSEMNEWSPLVDLPEPRVGHAASAYRQLIFITGGVNSSDGNFHGRDSLWCYHTVEGIWETNRTRMFSGRYGHNMVTFKDKLYVCGGRSNELTKEMVPTLEEYDILKDTWKVLSTMPTERLHTGFCLMDDSLYVVGGSAAGKYWIVVDKIVDGLFEVYDIYSAQWTHYHVEPDEAVLPVFLTLRVPLNFEKLYTRQLIDTFTIKHNAGEPRYL